MNALETLEELKSAARDLHAGIDKLHSQHNAAELACPFLTKARAAASDALGHLAGHTLPPALLSQDKAPASNDP